MLKALKHHEHRTLQIHYTRSIPYSYALTTPVLSGDNNRPTRRRTLTHSVRLSSSCCTLCLLHFPSLFLSVRGKPYSNFSLSCTERVCHTGSPEVSCFAGHQITSRCCPLLQSNKFVQKMYNNKNKISLKFVQLFCPR
jgi:hypothetical protein